MTIDINPKQIKHTYQS